ncbi:hypothetical protein ACET9R_03540 [Aeromonas veronii]
MNPSLKEAFAAHLRRYKLTNIMKRHIVSQLNGTVDAVRVRAFWRINQPNIAGAERTEQLTKALKKVHAHDCRGTLFQRLHLQPFGKTAVIQRYLKFDQPTSHPK